MFCTFVPSVPRVHNVAHKGECQHKIKYVFVPISNCISFFTSSATLNIVTFAKYKEIPFVANARIIKIGNMTRSNFGKLYCYSFATAFFLYVIVNMSMVLGLLPIVGAPLPIMSYGGSSMLATMIGFGIVMSAKVHNQQSIA